MAVMESYTSLEVASVYLNERRGKMRNYGVVDVFCGVGGASLGFKLAGFRVLGAVDIDPVACKTYACNLALEPLCGDLRQLSYREILEHFDLSREDVTVLVGCPPCQTFSSLRRTRPWRGDLPKDELLVTFLRLICEGLPGVVVFENVHGIATSDGGRYLKYYLEEMRNLGYSTVLSDVNAADHGVPQFRKRVVAFSVLGVEANELVIPEATHAAPAKAQESGKLPWTTVREAISDLPPLEPGEEHPSVPKIYFQ